MPQNMLIWYITFILVVLIAIYLTGIKDAVDEVVDLETAYYDVKVIGQRNASRIINDRVNAMQSLFVDAYGRPGWKLLRSSKNTTIDILAASDGYPSFLKTTTHIGAESQKVFSKFQWNNFHKTQKAIDPFFENAETIAMLDNIRLLRKTTKRPLIFPKREFILGSVDLKQRNTISVTDRRTSTVTVIPRGTLISALVSIKIDESSFNTITERGEQFVLAYQDFMSWYIPEQYGTKLIVIMRVDLGKDIPRWIFLTTIAATGIWSVNALKKLLEK